MSLKFARILGVNVTIENEENILEETRKYFLKSEIPRLIRGRRNPKSEKKSINPLIIFTPNPEIVVLAQKDDEYKRIVNSAQIKLPDGAGIIWAVNRLEKVKIRRVSGADFMLHLVKLAEEKALTIGIIGGRGGLAVEAIECLQKTFKDVKMEALGEPEIDTKGGQAIDSENYFQNLKNDIDKRKIEILFVALGFPKQEYFIENIKIQISKSKKFRPIILMAVGGSLEYISGRIPRAPGQMRRAGLEWLWRLVLQPWRIKRQLAGQATVENQAAIGGRGIFYKGSDDP